MHKTPPTKSLRTKAETFNTYFRMGLASFALFSLCFLVVACGKKPERVDAPPGVDSAAYNQSYPDLSTDPPPNARP